MKNPPSLAGAETNHTNRSIQQVKFMNFAKSHLFRVFGFLSEENAAARGTRLTPAHAACSELIG
jgi:hypothetical protein